MSDDAATIAHSPPTQSSVGQSPIRVLVVAEVRMYREGLAAAVGAEGHIEVVAAHRTLPADLAAAAPDIVLLDVTSAESLAAVRAIRRELPDARVVAVAMPEVDRDLLAFAEAGIAGYVTQEQSIEDVVAVVEAVARGEMICSPRIAATLLRHVASLAAQRGSEAAARRLTQRELEIVALIEHGLSNKQIARHLQIELATVKNHVHNILEKLHVDRRTEAAARVRAQGLGRLPRLDPSLPKI